MKGRPGSLIWLVRHDLLLTWRRVRAIFGTMPLWKILSIMAGLFIILHLMAAPVALKITREIGIGGIALAIANGAMFVIPWQLSQGISQSARILYSQGDLDLLLGSPISARVVAASHTLALTIESTISIGIFLVPIANIMAYEAGLRWLTIYPVIFASALFATAAGLAITVLLFAIFGPRRTHVAAQILSTFIASVFILGLQIVQMVQPQTREKILNVVRIPGWGEFLDDRDGIFWLPVRAALGETSDLLIWFGLAIGSYALVAILLGPMFLRSAVRSAGQAAALGSLHRPREDRPFRPGVARALWRKELQLLGRDTSAMSQLFLQMAYTAPISLIIWASANEDSPIAMALSPTIVMIACHLSAALTWLALSSEDAPQMMASAPVTRREIERRKLEAVCGPLFVVICLPIIWLFLYEPRNALITACFAAAAGACTALLNVWNPLPGRRGDLMRRHAPSKIVALMEHLFAMFLAIGVVAAVMGRSVIWIVALGAAALLLWLNYRRARKRWVRG